MKPNYTIRNSLPGITCDINFTNNSVLYMKKQQCRYMIAGYYETAQSCIFPANYSCTNLYQADFVVPGSEICMYN